MLLVQRNKFPFCLCKFVEDCVYIYPVNKTITMLSLQKVFYALCVVLSVFSAKAQTIVRDSDYVIKMTGDTIKCHVNTPFIGAISYTTDGDISSTKIKANEHKEYFVSRKNVTYRSVTKKGKNKPLFLRLVEKGDICLYEEIVYSYSMYGSSSVTIWHVSKKSDVVEQLKFSSLIAFNKQSRKTAFADMIMDNKAVYDKYLAEDKKFTFDQIQSLVRLYNTGQ
jgi:hypothetical protein